MARWSAAVLVVLAALAGVAAGGDIVHQDDEAPKIPGCSNDFMLVRPSFPPRFISS
jgi:signal peptide peptidase-like 2B